MRPLRPLRCRARVKIGKRLESADTVPTEVCLSVKQFRALFDDRPGKKLGCGTFACAWEDPRGGVTKITLDESDVEGLRRGQGLTHVAKIGRAVKLKGEHVDEDGKRRPAWAIGVEKLAPLPEHLAAAIPDARYALGIGDTRSEVVASVCRINDKSCEKFAGELFDTYRELQKRGVEWDDMHAGNVGVDSNGVWKILDLGASGLTAEVPELAGTRRGKSRKRRRR